MKPIRWIVATLAAVGCLAGPAGAGDWPQWGGTADRNMVSDAKGLPDRFDALAATARPVGGNPRRPPQDPPSPATTNVKWAARLGTQTYGNPTVSGGRVFVGTNNGAPRDPKYVGDRGVLMCFDEADGRFLWQLVVPKLPQGGQFNADEPGLGICSSPTVDGDRVYVTTSRCEVLCLDVKGMADGNGGPFKDEAACVAKPRDFSVTEEQGEMVVRSEPGDPVAIGPTDADILWRFDMLGRLKVWPQDATNCSVLIWKNYVYVTTSNGVDKSHAHVPSPKAPSLIVLDKRTGELVAVDDADIGPRILHGQWSSPSLGVVGGRTLVFYGGGDGCLYAFDAEPVPGKGGAPGRLRKVWWFDCNPPEYRVGENGKPIPYKSRAGGKDKDKGAGRGPSEIIATPVFHDGRVYVAVGQDPRHGPGAGCLSCVSAGGTGDVTRSGLIWRATGVDRSLSTVSVADGLVYAADYTGVLHCLDSRTGQTVWTHDCESRVWGSTLVADGKVYLGTEGRRLLVLAAGREKKVLGEINMGAPVYTTAVVANGVLYVASQRWLYAVQAGIGPRSASTAKSMAGQPHPPAGEAGDA